MENVLCPYPSDPIRPVEAANLLGVHQSQVYRWVQEGLLRAWLLPSGHRRLSRAEVLELPKLERPRAQPVRIESRVELLARRRETDETLRRLGVID